MLRFGKNCDMMIPVGRTTARSPAREVFQKEQRTKMKKVLIVILCVVIAVVAGLGGWLIASQKTETAETEIAYPDGLKQVDSAAAIEQELAGYENLCVYDLSQTGAADVSYLVRMSNEYELAEAEGYEIVGMREVAGTQVKYRLVCEGKAMEYISADEMPYRDVPLEVSYKQQTEDCTNQGWCLTFPLKGYSFCLWASYSVADMSYEDMADIYGTTYYDLLDMAEGIIDSALDGADVVSAG